MCDSIVFKSQCNINKGRQMTHKGMSKKKTTTQTKHLNIQK
jgi:hypothetical protein